MKTWLTGERCQVEVVPGHWREAKFVRYVGQLEAVVQVQGFASKYKVTRKLANIKEVEA